MVAEINCSICGSSCVETFPDLYDDRFGYPGRFAVQVCPSCDHKFLSGDLPESLSELYTRYYPRSDFDIEQFRPHRKPNFLVGWLNGGKSSAFRWVPENVRVLDIGCGMGETLVYHTSRGCEAYGVDTDANVLRIAERYSFNIQIEVFDASLYEPDFFDYVTLDQVIEHVSDIRKTLADVASVMKIGGVCVLSTPNSNGWGVPVFGKKWLHWHVPYHLHFFSPESLRRTAAEAGFSVERVMTITRSEWILYQMLHLAGYPRQGEMSFFWGNGQKRNFVQRLFIGGVMSLRFTLLPQFLTRIFDAIGLGDNYVVELIKIETPRDE